MFSTILFKNIPQFEQYSNSVETGSDIKARSCYQQQCWQVCLI